MNQTGAKIQLENDQVDILWPLIDAATNEEGGIVIGQCLPGGQVAFTVVDLDTAKKLATIMRNAGYKTDGEPTQ